MRLSKILAHKQISGLFKHYDVAKFHSSKLNTLFLLSKKGQQDRLLLRISKSLNLGLVKKVSGRFGPKLIISSNKFNFCVERFIGGRHPAKTKKDIEMIAKNLKKLHNYEIKRNTDMSTDIINFKRLNLILANIRNNKNKQYVQLARNIKCFLKNRKMFEYFLRYANSQLSIIHGDLKYANILIKNNEAIFIDWDKIAYGDPAKDVAYLFVHDGFNNNQRNLFLNEYGSSGRFFQERVTVYITINILNDIYCYLEKGPTTYEADFIKTGFGFLNSVLSCSCKLLC